MREIVGFAAGIVAGTAGTLFVASESGRRLRETLLREAGPELRTAAQEWDPLIREVVRAARLATRELEDTAARVRQYVASLEEEMAANVETDEGGKDFEAGTATTEV
jgi:gas vesicle protein